MEEEENNYNDAYIEAMIGKILLDHPKDLFCEAGKTIQRVCTNAACGRYSLLCGNCECKSCDEDAHERCAVVKLKGITSIINEQTSFRKETVSRIS